MKKRFRARNGDLFAKQLGALATPALQLREESTKKYAKSSSDDDDSVQEIRTPASSPIRKPVQNRIGIFNRPSYRPPKLEAVDDSDDAPCIITKPKETEYEYRSNSVSSFYTAITPATPRTATNCIKRAEAPRRERPKSLLPDFPERKQPQNPPQRKNITTGTKFIDTRTGHTLTYLTTSDSGLYVLMNEEMHQLVTIRRENLTEIEI